ncbi:MAG: hypothetical protein ABW042_04680 [Phenylobacterium sp.]
MKKFILTLAAASALAGAAAPAMAQSWNPGYDNRYEDNRYDDRRYDDRYDRGRDDRGRGHDIADRLERRLERSWQMRQINRQEYFSLRQSVRQLQVVEDRYQRDGVLTRWEREDLARRADYVATRLRMERADRDWGAWR